MLQAMGYKEQYKLVLKENYKAEQKTSSCKYMDKMIRGLIEMEWFRNCLWR